MKQAITLSNYLIERTLSSVHNIRNVDASSEDDAKSALENIVRLLNLDKILNIVDVIRDTNERGYSIFRIRIENRPDKDDEFQKALEVFTGHITLSNPILHPDTKASTAANIVVSFFETLPPPGPAAYNKFVGVTDMDEDKIKMKFCNPKIFSYLKDLSSENALSALTVLISKKYKTTEFTSGKNLFAFGEKIR